jgi:hypothetical protein
MRFVAGVSRVSLRDPFAPASDLTDERTRRGIRRRRNGHIEVGPLPTNGHHPHHQHQDEEEDDRVPAPV